MSTEHDPDPAFVQHLEWQLRTALRRKERFALPVPAPAWRRLRSAALVLASLVLGAASVVAAERIHQSRERDLLLTQARIRIEVERARLDHAETRHALAAARFDAGVVAAVEVARAERRRAQARERLLRTELDLAELELSGRAPRDALDTAPVAGRDFVGERLRVELDGARAELDERERERAELEAMYRNGLVSGIETTRAELRGLEAAGRVRAVERLLELRRDFLGGSEPRQRVRLLAERIRAVSSLETARARLDPLRRELETLQRQVAAGVANQGEAEEVRQRLIELEGEVQLLELEVERIDERLVR